MPPLRPLYWFVLKLAICYGLLLIPWPGVFTGYRMAFCTLGNTFLRTLGDGGRVYFSMKSPPYTQDRDISAAMENIRSRSTGVMEMSSRTMGYLPTCFTISLIVATPIPWRRRGLALLLGLALMFAFVGLLMWLRLANVLSNPDNLAVYSFGPFLKRLLFAITAVLAMSPVTPYIVSSVFWVLVAIRREDMERLARGLQRGTEAAVRRATGL